MEPRVTEQIEPCFVRISMAGEGPVGAGFLISQRHVLTCHHVVADALGIDRDRTEKPQGEVDVTFQFLPEQPTYKAQVEDWWPLAGPPTSPSGDIALLRLNEEPLVEARYARLTTAIRGRKFRAHGIPLGSDAGEWAEGEVRGELGNKWWQVEATRVTGKRIQEGYSGGPVEDTEIGSIVGMVSASGRDRVERVGYIIPTEVLTRYRSDLIIKVESRSATTARSQEKKFSPREFVGRKKEQELFDELLNQDDARLLTIRDKSERGKSSLLQMFEYKCKMEYYPPIPASLILLDQSTYTPLTLIREIRSELYDFEENTGLELPFARFDTHDAQRVARHQTTTQRHHGNPGDRTTPEDLDALARTKYINAFLADLKQISDAQPIVLLLDPWERADDKLQTFIINRVIRPLCLDTSARPEKFILVLAGTEQPDLDAVERERLMPIEPLSPFEERDIQEFLELRGYEGYTEENVRNYCALINSEGLSLQFLDMWIQTQKLPRAG